MKSRALNKPLSKLFAGLGIFIGQVATPTIVVLQALDSASAVFPPLKGALELVNFIITSVNDFKTNSGEWKAFGKFVCPSHHSLVTSAYPRRSTLLGTNSMLSSAAMVRSMIVSSTYNVLWKRSGVPLLLVRMSPR